MEAQVLATDIVKKLTIEGYTAYFAGGWVRDFLMGHPSDDIDIATNAPPEKILDLFPRTILVGLAFGVIVVVIKGHQFEVATFRKDVAYVNGRTPTEIELSTPREDALRRDFTINGMFYDPLENEVHDFVEGAEDIKRKVIRTIGNAYERFFEDRLRMIRAVRFAARFGFAIDSETQEAIRANAVTLFPAVAMERIWQEFCKMAKYPHFDEALIDMHRLELLPTIFPRLKSVHLHDIRHYVASFAHYPQKVETILYLMGLFPTITAGDAVEICKYLKTSSVDARLAEFFVHVRIKVQEAKESNAIDKVEWVHLYAHSDAKTCLQVVAASMGDSERVAFLEHHQKRIKMFENHIQRVVDKMPLINASMLIEKDIERGKIMGILLKEAERIAILNDLNDSGEVMNRLKATSLWPK